MGGREGGNDPDGVRVYDKGKFGVLESTNKFTIFLSFFLVDWTSVDPASFWRFRPD